MTQHGHSERRDYMALNFKQHNHSKATTSSHNNRRSEPDPQQPHWNRPRNSRPQVSILGNHFAYNIAGYHSDFPPPHFSGSSSKYLISQNVDSFNIVSSYDFCPRSASTPGYPYTVRVQLPGHGHWPSLGDLSSMASSSSVSPTDCSRQSVEMESEVKSLMEKLHHFSIKDLKPHVVFFFASRHAAIATLNQMAAYWIGQVAARRNQPLGKVDQMQFIRAFGSYGLGICGQESDLDAVLVAPRFVRREDFFDDFVQLLRNQTEVIKDVCAVENAFVPVVKFSIDGVEVDLTFATLAKAAVPVDENALLMDDMLVNMDDKSIRSLNGWRVCRFILNYVPNLEIFRTVLMVVKDWAKARQIYSNSCGYLGGVSWAILVAHVCKTHPSASVVVQIRNFFACFATWDWKKPVMLTSLQLPSCQCFEFDMSNNGPYDPAALYENHLMPIMTPCYPYQNSSFNITRTTHHYIAKTIQEASGILLRIQEGKATWTEFFQKADPFSQYSSFLILLIHARDDSTLKRWKGCVESKIRQLMQSFENIRDMKRVQIFPVSYRVKGGSGEEREKASCIWLVGLDHMSAMESIKKAIAEWRATINLQGLAMLKNDQNGLYSVECAVKGSNHVRQMLTSGQDNAMTLSAAQSGFFGSNHMIF